MEMENLNNTKSVVWHRKTGDNKIIGEQKKKKPVVINIFSLCLRIAQ